MLTGAAVLILLAVVVILDQVVTIRSLRDDKRTLLSQLTQTEQDRRVLGDALISEVEENL